MKTMRLPIPKINLLSSLLATLLVSLATAQTGIEPVPEGYYSTAEGKTGVQLANALHDIIDGHTIIPYNLTDDAFLITDRDPSNANSTILIYSRASEPFTTSTGIYNREHLWPRSRGISDSGPDNSDLFNLRPSFVSINSDRANLIFDVSDVNSGGYRPPGSFSLAPEVSRDSDSWEPPDVVKGSIARSMFYMAVRYDGSDAATTDLILTNNLQLSSTELGALDTLLAWHRQFPVTDRERLRNQLIFNDFQGNRNPFIDFPDFADMIFNPEPPHVFGGVAIIGFSGWRSSSWYLNYNVEFWPWIYHDEHGWQFVAENSAEEVIFLWDLGLGEWTFLNATTYRWIYLFGENSGWIFTFSDNTPNSRFFQRLDDGSIFSVPAGLPTD